ELRDLFRVLRILDDAFLQHLPELAPERCVFFRLPRRQLTQHAEYPARQCATYRLQLTALLQQLSRDVQGQVSRIDNALYEAQVERQELLRLVHDEDALHIELQAPRCFPVPEVERRVLRDVQQARVFLLALDAIVAPGQRIGKIVR